MFLFNMEKIFEPKKIEERWYKFWLEKGYFHANENSDKKSYCIVIPPPNITGALHIGHALNNTIQDILIRYKRMEGFNTLWMPGTDHAGIATQNVVERQLLAEGADRHKIGREEFVERVWKWKEKSGGDIIRQLKRLGASCDWERERFTMDEGLSKAVREVFVRLYDEGLIYKGDRLINWCPRCHTALSDLEVEHEEQKGHLYHIKYPVKNTSDFITIATTRPETMLGDTAVAVNPDDERYKNFTGKTVTLPIVNREIPVIADSYVDKNFGTGALKITPAHDPNDFEIGTRHNLLQVKVIAEDGTMNENAGKYKGLDRFKCRKALLSDLENEGFLIKVEDYVHSVGKCYRCKTIVEPNLSKQWFVKIKPLSEPALEAVKDGRIRIIPKGWENTYFEWMNNIKDWCISRQIWWGHRIPAWNCLDCGEITVSKTDVKECSKCKSKNIEQESDVLDTWFSSALWPFSTLGWPENTKELEAFYPTSVLVTSFDILFFWVARMIMMGLKFRGDIPFRDVYIHALVRDSEGQKMSKSKGNVIDPLIMMEKYGTDAFRFTLAAFAAQGRDIKLSEERIEGYRNFANKIWNAFRFAMMNLEDYISSQDIVGQGFSLAVSKPEGLPYNLQLSDRWIISRLQKAIADTRKGLTEYKFNESAGTIYQFFWHELCDWYIEIIKPRLAASAEERKTAQSVLLYVMENSLRLLHPFMPFITEELWQQLPHSGESIMTAEYPVYNEALVNEDFEREMILIMEISRGIRNIRSEMNISLAKKLDVILRTGDEKKLQMIERQNLYISELSRLKNLSVTRNGKEPKMAATAVVEDIEIFVLLEGVIDIQEERNRLSRELEKINSDIATLNKRLSNRDFINRAPKDVVEKDREKYQSLTVIAEKIQQNLSRLEPK
ncbi:MAG: valine--tRNA ligase [Nitrospinae bacterium RIFCSPLOWO2_01_FULL_39_10]|nr:MAG: valine--tRNA ligase [Nitrospinae bacterium RIFCSPLOWO2_01_FULL_39_10]